MDVLPISCMNVLATIFDTTAAASAAGTVVAIGVAVQCHCQCV
jgi:hypothetical protein